MITPLDPNEGDIYNDSINEDEHNFVIENIYNIKGWREYYINPTNDG